MGCTSGYKEKKKAESGKIHEVLMMFSLSTRTDLNQPQVSLISVHGRTEQSRTEQSRAKQNKTRDCMRNNGMELNKGRGSAKKSVQVAEKEGFFGLFF